MDASNSTVGVRIVYGKGCELFPNLASAIRASSILSVNFLYSLASDATASAPWPRAILYDFECNKEATDNKPLSVTEFPMFTYTGMCKKTN